MVVSCRNVEMQAVAVTLEQGTVTNENTLLHKTVYSRCNGSVLIYSSYSFAHKSIDRLHNGQNFEKFRNSKIHYDSIKEHLKLSKIGKFGCEML